MVEDNVLNFQSSLARFQGLVKGDVAPSWFSWLVLSCIWRLADLSKMDCKVSFRSVFSWRGMEVDQWKHKKMLCARKKKKKQKKKKKKIRSFSLYLSCYTDRSYKNLELFLWVNPRGTSFYYSNKTIFLSLIIEPYGFWCFPGGLDDSSLLSENVIQTGDR